MEEFWMQIGQEAIMTIAGIVFAAIGALGVFYIRKLVAWLVEKQALEAVARYVRWAEQAPAFQDFSGDEKFEMVFSSAMQYIESKGIPIDEDEIAIMIEDAVSKMKEAAKPLYYGPIVPQQVG